MNSAERLSPLLESVRSEHRPLQEMVRGMGDLLASPGPNPAWHVLFDQLKTCVADLREHLAAHFAREESGGFLEHATTELPRLASEATALEKEHPDLLREFDKFLELTSSIEPSEAEYHRLAIEFRRVAKLLLTHEVAENRLLQQGFNEDLGLDD